MYKVAIVSVMVSCVLFGCASSDVRKIDHQIQKANYKKIERQEQMLQFISSLKSGYSFEHVKQLLETQQFKFTDKLEKRTRVDGKVESKVKKINFWITDYPEDKYTLLFQCISTQKGILKAAYHGVTEIQLVN